MYFPALIKHAGRMQHRTLIKAATQGAKCSVVKPRKFKFSLQIFIYVCCSQQRPFKADWALIKYAHILWQQS